MLVDFPRHSCPGNRSSSSSHGSNPAMARRRVIDLTDLGFILAGMAEENPRHHALSFSGCLVIVCRVSCCTPSIAQVQGRRGERQKPLEEQGVECFRAMSYVPVLYACGNARR